LLDSTTSNDLDRILRISNMREGMKIACKLLSISLARMISNHLYFRLGYALRHVNIRDIAVLTFSLSSFSKYNLTSHITHLRQLYYRYLEAEGRYSCSFRSALSNEK